MIREIVKIDEDKCDGCGLCVPACAEGAIQIVDGKARLIADNLCDGLGACLGDCPRDAITIVKREAAEFDEEAVEQHLRQAAQSTAPTAPARHHAQSGGCPSARLMEFTRKEPTAADEAPGKRESQLRQWPIQMHLVPPSAPFFKDAELVLAADCAPFAYADFHQDILKGKALAIGCPKLDDGRAYLEKLTAILRQNNIRGLTVVHMEVPCCSGLLMIARQAIADSGKDVPLTTIKVGIRGDCK
ncbi:ATP-binding protein [Geoalkalibacter sp.]|uniref:ATP-binding protein n=1 Tax=Geoalkalibacter sp. TaxID=3041440 RepID=UPI00272E36C3|nr:4Fe-4S binding protein [Geoalkalibacter sp.]